MSENRKKILEMLARNKITAEEAERLLELAGNEEATETGNTRASISVKENPKYLRVTVLPDADHAERTDVDRVNVKVPMSLIRAGIKLTSLIPSEAKDKVDEALQDKGIDFDVRNLKPEEFEQMIEAISDLEVDVSTAKGEKIKVFVE
jgi:hypothetical protein